MGRGWMEKKRRVGEGNEKDKVEKERREVRERVGEKG